MRTNGRKSASAEPCCGYARRGDRPAEREQNWYPISKLGWFTSHIREGVAVTLRQLELLQPGPPSGVTLTWTDNATAPAATLVRVSARPTPGSPSA